jgi:putative FmdB family regulatory protein
MPTYEFRCPLGHDFEKFYRSIGAAPVEVACPVCGKIAERQLSGAGLVFKGSGFYITDYGKDGKKSQTPPAVAAKEGAGASSGAESTGKSDSSDTSGSASSDSKPVAETKTATPKPTAEKTSSKKAKDSE